MVQLQNIFYSVSFNELQMEYHTAQAKSNNKNNLSLAYLYMIQITPIVSVLFSKCLKFISLPFTM